MEKSNVGFVPLTPEANQQKRNEETDDIKYAFDQISHSSDEEDNESRIECICNGTVTDNHMVIACDLCDKWFHRKCSGLLVRQWKFFKENQTFKWYCKFCHDIMSDRSSMSQVISKSQEAQK